MLQKSKLARKPAKALVPILLPEDLKLGLADCRLRCHGTPDRALGVRVLVAREHPFDVRDGEGMNPFVRVRLEEWFQRGLVLCLGSRGAIFAGCDKLVVGAQEGHSLRFIPVGDSTNATAASSVTPFTRARDSKLG
jgi:hypothetical protein